MVVGRWWGLAERRKLDAGGGRAGGGGCGGTQAVGPVVRSAARLVFCMGSTVCSLSGRGAGTSAVDTSMGPVLLNDFALRVGLP